MYYIFVLRVSQCHIKFIKFFWMTNILQNFFCHTLLNPTKTKKPCWFVRYWFWCVWDNLTLYNPADLYDFDLMVLGNYCVKKNLITMIKTAQKTRFRHEMCKVRYLLTRGRFLWCNFRSLILFYFQWKYLLVRALCH